jgi:hypothetical protein
LQPRSRRPKHCPHKTDEEVEPLVRAERKRHPRWVRRSSKVHWR